MPRTVKERQDDELRDHERWLGLLRSHRGQGGNLQESLRHPDEAVDVERDGGADRVGPTPRAGAVEREASDDRPYVTATGDRTESRTRSRSWPPSTRPTC